MNKTIFSFLSILCFAGCSQNDQPAEPTLSKSNLTSGQVSLTLKKNTTSQAEVAEVFGAPNLVTNNADGEEVWIYQRHATSANASSSSFSGGFGALSLATILVGGSIGGGSSSASKEQSSRTITLIIRFKEFSGVKRVVDFSSRYTSF